MLDNFEAEELQAPYDLLKEINDVFGGSSEKEWEDHDVNQEKKDANQYAIEHWEAIHA